MTRHVDPYCRYCGQLPGFNPNCRNHPQPLSPTERLEARVEALERELAELKAQIKQNEVKA